MDHKACLVYFLVLEVLVAHSSAAVTEHARMKYNGGKQNEVAFVENDIIKEKTEKETVVKDRSNKSKYGR